MQRAMSTAAAAALLMVLAPAPARAVPGPDSVAVLANADVPGSVALAERYARERSIPDRQVCALPMPATEDVSLADFEATIRAPLEECLSSAGVVDRIESIVIARGVPLRVTIDVGGTTRRASLAAALGLWRTTMDDGTAVLGEDPGATVDCGGTPCWGARWRSAYRAQPFRAGWERSEMGVTHRPVLVTMLHGRSDADAELLIDSALASEGMGAEGEFLFMNGADAARGALDRDYDGAIGELTASGLTATRVPFDAELTGRSLAAFFTGTASIGTTIEGNDFLPGALVDNLTSFGAVPENFRETGESQVSIARWVARGVAGVHGTTAEPLNNCFPSRWLIADYVTGATLAEAYWGRMPFVYWHNLVLGDPITAPYAQRPVVTIEGVADGGTVAAGTAIRVTATPAAGRTVEEIVLYVDGVEVSSVPGETWDPCLVPAPGDDVQILAVATVAGDDDHWPARGWASLRVSVTAGDDSCAPLFEDGGPSEPDAGVAGADAGGGAPPPSGCACRVSPRAPWPAPAIACALSLVALAGARGRRGRGAGEGA